MSTIRLLVKTSKETLYPGQGRRRIQHTASIGALKASADSEVLAREELTKLVQRATETENAIIVMYSLCDQSEVWIASGDAHGWNYRIVRPFSPGSHYSRDSLIGGGWDREEARDHMMAHWYASNVQPIVEGIVALCTDLRQWVCPKCRYVQTSHAPYICQAPRCGHEAKPGPVCRACKMTLSEANNGHPDCPNTNSFEHDFPGYQMTVTLTPVDSQ